MYRIYFKQSTFILGDEDKLGAKYALRHNFVSVDKLHRYVNDKLRSDRRFVAFIYHNNEEELLRAFQLLFPVREAAGGLVEKKNKFLVIHKRGLWDFPKGHLEKGETRRECAKREVSEECQLKVSNLEIVDSICETRHIYNIKGKFYTKLTYWYSMVYVGEQKPQPQKKEGIRDAFWFSYKKVEYFLANTHPSIVEVLLEKRKKLL